MDKLSVNLGAMVMSGALTHEKNGYSQHYKATGTTGGHPGIKTTRLWERKLLTAFNIVERLGKRAETFGGRLLESQDLLEGKPCFGENGRQKKAKSPDGMIASVEKGAQRMLLEIENAEGSICFASKGAILPADKEVIESAAADLNRLKEKALLLASRAESLRREYGLDSIL
ncbi:MAG: hypothetical protein WCY41_00770 [Candidatus Micrarchaeia archaeon]